MLGDDWEKRFELSAEGWQILSSDNGCVPYLSALVVCSRQGAIQIHVYLYLYLVVIQMLTAAWDPSILKPVQFPLGPYA